MLTRRLFLAGAVAAPAIVRASSLMKIWVPPEPKVVVATAKGDLPFYCLDLGADPSRGVLSLFRDGDLVATFDAEPLRTGDVLGLALDAYGDAQVSVNGSRIAHWSEYATRGSTC